MPFPIVLAAAIDCCNISGTVRTAEGTPVRAHAHFAGRSRISVDSDASGRFVLHIAAGSFRLTITAPGFASTATDIVVHDGERIDVTLEPIGGGRLREISHVTIDGRLSLPRTTVPSREISRADLDAMGYDKVADALGTLPSVTLTRPDGGSPAAPTAIALRGPDPSETRISLDGQPLNDANTGDFDLALFPSALLGAVEVSEGLGPEDHRGADTIGGEVNLISLRPTTIPTWMLRLSSGSFNTSTIEASATGRVARLGYALAGGKAYSDGNVHDYPVMFGGVSERIGSSILTSSALVHLTYDLTPRVTLRFRTLSLSDTRDLSASESAPPFNQLTNADGPDAPNSPFVGSGPLTRAQNLRATLLGATLPLGAGTLAATMTWSSVRNALDGGIGSTPYDFSLNDRLASTTVEWSRLAGSLAFAIGGSVRSESLSSPDQFGYTLSERASTVWLRAATDLAPHVRVAGSAVRSNWSTFGSSTDGRFGIAVEDGAGGSLRFAAGTGFRAPLLSELYTAPFSALPPPDQNCVSANGNAAERAEHATEYELGYARRLGSTTFDATLYRTNLRDPIENFYPLNATCGVDPTVPVAQSFPINVGNVVYQGGTLRIARRFGTEWFASAEYGVNAAYPVSLPDTVSAANPTSGSSLVVGQQFAGIPLQEASLALRYSHDGFHGAANLTVTGANNWLAQGRYAVLDAAIGKRWGKIDLTLAGTNLSSAVTGRFTRIGLGTPYPIPNAPPQSRDALVLQPAATRLIFTIR